MSKRFRLGVLGAGRGAYLATLFQAHEDVEVVAGCDFNPVKLADFQKRFPDARTCADYDDLLRDDVDVVLVAGYCHDHAPQAIAALEAGKHVFSEVTAFHTPAEGVALVEAVERSGLQYMLAENYCYLREAQEMRHLFHTGELGELLYGECEYVHDIRPLMVREPDGSFHWRVWLPPFYYNTHSLGPILDIAGARPVSVVGQGVPGRITGSPNPWDFCAALVQLDSGAVVRVLLSFSAIREPSSVWYSVYGTKGSAENDRWQTVWGVSDLSVYSEENTDAQFQRVYRPRFRQHAVEAARAGHGGGDYFTVSGFLESLRNGTTSPIDVYRASDFTLPGILAYRSAVEGGQSLEVPDFRDPVARDKYRNDNFRCPRDEAVRVDQFPTNP